MQPSSLPTQFPTQKASGSFHRVRQPRAEANTSVPSVSMLKISAAPPQAGSKFSGTRKYRNRTDTSHSFPYMAIIWRLVNRGSERWGRQLLEFSWWLQELESGTRSLDSAGSRLDLVDRPRVKDCCLDSSWGYADARGYVKKVKLVWRGVFEIPFRFWIWHNGRLPSVTYYTSKSWCRASIRRKASSFPYVMLVLFCSVVSSPICVLFRETWMYICYVLLRPEARGVLMILYYHFFTACYLLHIVSFIIYFVLWIDPVVLSVC